MNLFFTVPGLHGLCSKRCGWIHNLLEGGVVEVEVVEVEVEVEVKVF